jgi:solute carrier family 13 (sodium-dependent dicarboxylate transporter), member 2/3/5
MSASEKRVLWLFGLVILGWASGSLVWYSWFDKTLGVGDTVVALIGAIGLFLIPARGISGEKLMDWKTAEKLPWGILLLFGGGLALAKGFEVSGLAKELGNLMVGLQNLPMPVILFVIFALIVLLSEVASNIATASMMMPVLSSLAAAIGVEPFGLLMTATLAASVGFMLPIATAPNTIVFSSGHLTTRDMMRAGFWLDLAAILLLIGFVFWVMPLVWGISL